MEGKSHSQPSPWARAGRGNAPGRGMGAKRAEGRGMGARRTERRLRPSGAVAGVAAVVAAIVAAALFFVRSGAGGATAPEAARPAKAAGASPRVSAPARPPAPKPAAGRAAAEPPVATAPEGRSESTSAGAGAALVGNGPERGWLVGAVTNADGGVVERWRLEDGRRMKRVRPPRRVFAHPTDELIAMALSGGESSEPPPMPSFGAGAEEAFRRSLGTPVDDLPGDDAATREAKRRVREARAEIARRVDAGETFAEVLASHVAARAELARERAARVAEKSAGRDVRDVGGVEGEKEDGE